MGILEDAQILRLGGIRRANQTGLDREVGLAETAARKKLVICDREDRWVSDGDVKGSSDD